MNQNKHQNYEQKQVCICEVCVDLCPCVFVGCVHICAPLHLYLCLCVYECVSQRCSKGREWWSGGRKGRLMDISLMGGSSTTIWAIRTGKRGSEDW